MGKIQPRDISPILKKFRNFLLGRVHTPALRFEPDVASRSPNPPQIPDGPHHKLNNNYYFKRDVRRGITPPLVVVKAVKDPVIEAGKGEKAACKSEASIKLRTVLPLPGKVHYWD